MAFVSTAPILPSRRSSFHGLQTTQKSICCERAPKTAISRHVVASAEKTGDNWETSRRAFLATSIASLTSSLSAPLAFAETQGDSIQARGVDLGGARMFPLAMFPLADRARRIFRECRQQ